MCDTCDTPLPCFVAVRRERARLLPPSLRWMGGASFTVEVSVTWGWSLSCSAVGAVSRLRLRRRLLWVVMCQGSGLGGVAERD